MEAKEIREQKVEQSVSLKVKIQTIQHSTPLQEGQRARESWRF